MTGWYGDDPIFRTLIWSLMPLDLALRRSTFAFRVASAANAACGGRGSPPSRRNVIQRGLPALQGGVLVAF